MNIRTHTRLTSAVMLAFLASATAAYAGSNSTTFNVTTHIDPVCSVSASNLGFGAYTGTQIDAVSTISVNCANATLYTVGLSDGFYPNGISHRMKRFGSSDYLSYRVFQNSARNVDWNNTTSLVSGTGTGSPQALTVYGRLFSGQSGPIGFYSDTITVTVNWM